MVLVLGVEVVPLAVYGLPARAGPLADAVEVGAAAVGVPDDPPRHHLAAGVEVVELAVYLVLPLERLAVRVIGIEIILRPIVKLPTGNRTTIRVEICFATIGIPRQPTRNHAAASVKIIVYSFDFLGISSAVVLVLGVEVVPLAVYGLPARAGPLADAVEVGAAAVGVPDDPPRHHLAAGVEVVELAVYLVLPLEGVAVAIKVVRFSFPGFPGIYEISSVFLEKFYAVLIPYKTDLQLKIKINVSVARNARNPTIRHALPHGVIA